jgi:hypothetical protein
MDFHRKTLRALNRPWAARTAKQQAECAAADPAGPAIARQCAQACWVQASLTTAAQAGVAHAATPAAIGCAAATPRPMHIRGRLLLLTSI